MTEEAERNERQVMAAGGWGVGRGAPVASGVSMLGGGSGPCAGCDRQGRGCYLDARSPSRLVLSKEMRELVTGSDRSGHSGRRAAPCPGGWHPGAAKTDCPLPHPAPLLSGPPPWLG